MPRLPKPYVIFVIVLLLVGQSAAKVARTSLNELTARADLIVIGRVTRLIQVKEVTVAELQVIRTLKGAHFAKLYYLAQPTWTCDTTDAEVGEESLFFFENYVFDPEPASMAFVKQSSGKRGYEIKSGAIKIGFKEPLGFKGEIRALTANSPFLAVSWSGRGRMPIREIKGLKYVTLWTGDVNLPEDLKTIPGPERECAEFIRSVQIIDLTAHIQKELTNKAR
jgi:hypothetical protein